MNVMILGAKPSSTEPAACRAHEELFARIGRIEKCLERIEKALAEAGEPRESPRPRGKAGTGTSRSKGSGSSCKTSGGRDESGSLPQFITGSSRKGGGRQMEAAADPDGSPDKATAKTQQKQ